MPKVAFFFLSLTHFFIMATYQRFLTAPAQARKQSVHNQNLFSLQNKGFSNPIQVLTHTKKQFKVV